MLRAGATATVVATKPATRDLEPLVEAAPAPVITVGSTTPTETVVEPVVLEASPSPAPVSNGNSAAAAGIAPLLLAGAVLLAQLL